MLTVKLILAAIILVVITVSEKACKSVKTLLIAICLYIAPALENYDFEEDPLF